MAGEWRCLSCLAVDAVCLDVLVHLRKQSDVLFHVTSSASREALPLLTLEALWTSQVYGWNRRNVSKSFPTVVLSRATSARWMAAVGAVVLTSDSPLVPCQCAHRDRFAGRACRMQTIEAIPHVGPARSAEPLLHRDG